MYDDYSDFHKGSDNFFGSTFSTSILLQKTSSSKLLLPSLGIPFFTSKKMDGDNTAKSFEQGANSAVKENEMSSGIHESVKQIVSGLKPLASTDGLMIGGMQPSAGEKTTGTGTSMFSKDGALGSMFNGKKSLRIIRSSFKHADTGHS